MRQLIFVMLGVVAGCGDNEHGRPPVETGCPTGLSTLPANERPTNVSSLTTVGCDYFLLDGTQRILQLGTDGKFRQIDPTVPSGHVDLQQMVALSPTDIWATNVAPPPPGAACESWDELHYDGVQWKDFPFIVSSMPTMWALPPSDVWFATNGPRTAHFPSGEFGIEHWSGSSFVNIVQPEVGLGFVSAGAASARADVWVCGTQTSHFDGTSWTSHSIGGVQCVAMFNTQGQEFLVSAQSVLHWDGTVWSPIYSADPTVQLAGMWGAAPDDLWVGGASVSSPTVSSGFLAHFDGKAWSPVAVNATRIAQIAGTGPDDVLFGGGSSLIHWDGHTLTDLSK